VLSATLLHGEFDLGVSAIVGSAVFNVLVIPAVSVLVAGPQGTCRGLLYRDAQFYLTSVSVLLVTFALAPNSTSRADRRLQMAEPAGRATTFRLPSSAISR